jgi:hypothetical protein
MESINLFMWYMLHAVMMYYLLMIGMKGLDISREKRYQDSNWLVKLSRRRHYLYIPFKWLYHQFIYPLGATDDMTGEVEHLSGKILWKILKGDAQGDMKWYYTMDEVRERFKIDPDSDVDYDYIDLEDDIDTSEYWKGND